MSISSLCRDPISMISFTFYFLLFSSIALALDSTHLADSLPNAPCFCAMVTFILPKMLFPGSALAHHMPFTVPSLFDYYCPCHPTFLDITRPNIAL
ncbi:hypothetical protein F4604DRAFT_1782815 [Suillus subluteus]|nr:hypothetical protein F4604DRAFT_1782815 [Suillus subluteus]